MNLLKTLMTLLANSGLVRRSTVRDLFFLLAKGFTPVLVSDIGPATFYVSTADQVIGRQVFFSGGFEQDDVLRLLDILTFLGHTGLNTKALVDVGANIGTTCLPLLRQGKFANAVAFEPEFGNFALLEQNIRVNGLEASIRAFRMALSDREQTLTFEISPGNSGAHRVSTGAASEHAVTARATTFDHLIDEGILKTEDLGLVWIDTQGYEGHILQGASSLLASDVPVLIEFWPPGLARTGGKDLLINLVRQHYTHIIDLGASHEVGAAMLQPSAEIAPLWTRYFRRGDTDAAETITNLLLLKRSEG